MSIKGNKIANAFASRICSDFKINEAINHLRNEAIEALQGQYGDPGRGIGREHYSALHIYISEKFDWWFEHNLNEIQKEKLIELSEDSEKFEINIYSHNRDNLVLDFLIKLKRTDIDGYTNLHIFIDFPSINEDKHEIYAEMFDQLNDDEISKMLMRYELNH